LKRIFRRARTFLAAQFLMDALSRLQFSFFVAALLLIGFFLLLALYAWASARFLGAKRTPRISDRKPTVVR
jgi:hypothetical protein